jgi:hypothetical protein
MNEITTEDVQTVKAALTGWSLKNVLTALSMAPKTAVEWGVIVLWVTRQACGVAKSWRSNGATST